jgi:hypothetical protein
VQGLLGMAMAPVTKFQQRRADDALRRERASALMEGANMRLLQSRGSTPVRIALSRDSAMVTYQSLNGPSESGVISLAIVREVKPVLVGGILRSQTPVPMQWMVRIFQHPMLSYTTAFASHLIRRSRLACLGARPQPLSGARPCPL